MILGLDVSTSVIGWCLLHDDGRFESIGHIDLTKEETLYAKLLLFEEFVETVDFTNINKIVVEEPLMMFKANASMAQTIAKLQRFNGMVCALLLFKSNTAPIMINPMTARKLSGIKVPRKVDTKKFILHHVQSLGIIPAEVWEKKRTGNFKDWCYDQADAWVVANAGLKSHGDLKKDGVCPS
jgi:hypothetical protein